jgi:hypothetical protein
MQGMPLVWKLPRGLRSEFRTKHHSMQGKGWNGEVGEAWVLRGSRDYVKRGLRLFVFSARPWAMQVLHC